MPTAQSLRHGFAVPPPFRQCVLGAVRLAPAHPLGIVSAKQFDKLEFVNLQNTVHSTLYFRRLVLEQIQKGYKQDVLYR